MPVTSTHPDYDANLLAWRRARDIVAGEDAIKAGGERYLARLEGQTDGEYASYLSRGAFYNATARTADGFLGLVFRRPPFVKLPAAEGALGCAMRAFVEDADMLGSTLTTYARNVVSEVLVTGRAGTLVDWEEGERRVCASLYGAERITNWRVSRVKGRSVLTLLVLAETVLEEGAEDGEAADGFERKLGEQLRTLRLVPVAGNDSGDWQCVVEVWRPVGGQRGSREWVKVESHVPHRRGHPLPLIPFVFHGPRHCLPVVDKLPLADVIAVNMAHYRLDVDYKHGMHFTALPTAYVSGFNPDQPLMIGSRTAWVTETLGATAGFLEYTGQGLTTFERAMDRAEKLLAVLGARLLESQKRVGETAESIELRQSGENSVLGAIAASLSASLTQILRWCAWWNGSAAHPDEVAQDDLAMELNTDFSTKGMSAQEVTALVSAWQAGALSRETMLHLFRRGEVLPEGRTDEEEKRLIAADLPAENPRRGSLGRPTDPQPEK